MPKTRQEVEELKASWRRDPCWDIADTEGFEEYKVELLAFQRQMEYTWKKKKEQEIIDFGNKIVGIHLTQKESYYRGVDGAIDTFKLLSFLFDLKKETEELKAAVEKYAKQLRDHETNDKRHES
jgi:hypothetical protein